MSLHDQTGDTSPQTPLALKRALQGVFTDKVRDMTDTVVIQRVERGVPVTVAMVLKDDPTLKMVSLGRCYDCYNFHGPYMVKNSVWEQAWPEYKQLHKKLQSLFPAKVHLFLCLHCLSQRLGRDVTLDDLTDAPVNDVIVLSYNMGRSFERLYGQYTVK